MANFIQTITDLAGQRPLLAATVVFLAAFSEALPVLGAVVPGSAIVIGVSALIGLGNHSVWPILGAAILGAIASDGLSYWFGHSFKARAADFWPLSAHPELMTRAQHFFDRHGGKSVAMARFTPVVRAFVPLIAGISGMNATRFYLANVLSAVGWAASHVLPSAAAGASLGVLGAISGRLLAVLVGLAVTILLLSWIFRIAWTTSVRQLASLQRGAHAWLLRREGYAARVLRDFVDPDNPSVREAAILMAVFAFSMIGLVNIVEDVVARGELARADAAMISLLSNLRTTWGDHVMVFITLLGDTPVTTAVALSSAAWIWWRGQQRLAVAMIVALGVTLAFVLGVKFTMHVTRPTVLYHGAEGFSFPSGHTTFAIVLYGILGWIIARDLSGYWRTAVLVISSTIGGLIAFSRLYLAAHWPSDVAAGLLFGAGTIAIFVLVFRRADLSKIARAPLSLIVVATLVVSGGWHVAAAYAKAVSAYAPVHKTIEITQADWRATGWMKLPAHRVDLGGEVEEPIVLQWGGDLAALRSALFAQGWKPAVAFNLQSIGQYLRDTATAQDLPALPLLQDGQPPVLTFVKVNSPMERSVLRLWSSPIVLSDTGQAPIFVGSIVQEQLHRLIGLVTYSIEIDGSSADLASLVQALPNATVVTRPASRLSDGKFAKPQKVALAAP